MSRVLQAIVVFKLLYLQYTLRYFFGSTVERVAFYGWVFVVCFYLSREFVLGKRTMRPAFVRIIMVLLGYIILGAILGIYRGNIEVVKDSVLSYIPVILTLGCLSLQQEKNAFSQQYVSLVSLVALLSVPLFFGLEIELSEITNSRENIAVDFYRYVSRASGLFANPNKAAYVANLIYALALAKSQIYLPRVRRLLPVLCGLVVFMTMSKSGMLVFIVLSIMSISLNRKNFMSLLLVGMLGLLLVRYVGFDSVQTSRLVDLQNILSFDFQEVNFSERDQRSGRALQDILQDPWGRGIGWNNMELASHNEYLRFMVDLGLFVGFVWTLLFGAVIAPLIRSKLFVFLILAYCLISQSVWNREEIFIFLFLLNQHVDSSEA